MLGIVSTIIAIALAALVIGLVKAKEFYERVLFLSSMTNLVVLMIVLLGSYKYNESYIDIALIYASLSFITMMAILKYTSGK